MLPNKPNKHHLDIFLPGSIQHRSSRLSSLSHASETANIVGMSRRGTKSKTDGDTFARKPRQRHIFARIMNFKRSTPIFYQFNSRKTDGGGSKSLEGELLPNLLA